VIYVGIGRWFLNFKINLFLPVNANINWLIMLVAQFWQSPLIKGRVDFNNDKWSVFISSRRKVRFANCTQSSVWLAVSRQHRVHIWYFTVRGQSFFSRLPKYWPPIPLSARRVCPPPATKAGGTHSPGGEGDGGSIFWKSREIGLPSYSKICTLWPAGTCNFPTLSQPKSAVNQQPTKLS
jgi:hypothetical protein